MKKYLDLEGLRKFKEQADAAYLPAKGTIPLTGSINLTTESVASLGIKYAKVANNSLNFYVIADSSGKLPSSETRININSSITSLVGAEGANVGDIFVVGKLDLKPVYKVIPLNDAKAANGSYAGTNGIMTPWDKARVNKVDGIEGTANNALNRANNALNNLPTLTETNMNNALATGVYPWCTLGRPAGSIGAYTCITICTTTKDNSGYDTIEQTAYGRQGELGRIFKRIIFKKDTEVQFGEWAEITNGVVAGGEIKKLVVDGELIATDNSTFTLKVPESVADRIIEIQGTVPCAVYTVQNGNLLTRGNFPLNSLGYRITRYISHDSYFEILIRIDRNIIYNNNNNNISSVITLKASPKIIISYI